MSRVFCFVFVLMMAGFPLALFAESEVEAEIQAESEAEAILAEQSLKILSWNIYMLPRWLLRHSVGTARRARAIGDRLSQESYDILVFQEAFDGKARRILKRKLSKTYPYSAGPAYRRIFSPKTNSGIWMLSKFPIEKKATIRYSERTGIDRWARKGSLLVEGQWQGRKFQFLGTHLQAGGSYEIKKSQVVQIKEEMLEKKVNPELPIFLCGDFNIAKANPEMYNFMLQTLGAEDGPISGPVQFATDHGANDLKDGNKDNVKLLDYILILPNGLETNWIRRQIRVFTQPWRMGNQDLSDHYAVEMFLVPAEIKSD